MNSNLEQQLNNLSNPTPRNPNFKIDLKTHLINEYSSKLEHKRLQRYLASNEQRSTKGFWKNFGKLGLAGTLSLILLLFFGSSVMAYYTIPTVKETINTAIGVYSTGYIDIKTSPEEVKVYVNGEYFGETPARLEFQEGNYSIRVEKEGYKTVSNKVKVLGNQTTELYITMESLIPEDPYKGWLTYNNELYSFGFRYDPDWEISEQEADAIKVNLTSERFSVSIQYLEEGAEPLPIEIEGDRQSSEYQIVECGKKLYTQLQYDTAQDSSIDQELIDSLEKFVSSLWLSCPVEEYLPPETQVENRFMWQIEDIVYTVNYTDFDLQEFTVSNNMQLKSISPDGRWVLYYGDGGVWLADTIGENKRLLVSSSKSSNGVYTNLSLEGSGWAPDSMSFIYSKDIFDISNCEGHCEGSEEMLSESPTGEKAGLYMFDLKTGESTYLVDSTQEFITNWSYRADYVYVYLNLENKIVLREYRVTDLSSYVDYELPNAEGFSTFQYDVYDRTQVVVRYGTIQNSRIVLAELIDGQIRVKKVLIDNLAWSENQFPRITGDGNYILFESDKYYNLQTSQLITYPTDYKFNRVYAIGDGEVVAVHSQGQNNNGVDVTIAVISLDSNSVKKVLLEKATVRNLTLPFQLL